VKQTRYEWVYLYAAVEPRSGASAALIAPNVDTGSFNAFLKILKAEIQPGEHAVLIMDQALRRACPPHRMAQNQNAGVARLHHDSALAAVLAAVESDREPLALPAVALS
jgi:hypothetical protein